MTTIRFLHLVPDDKFIDCSIEQFDLLENSVSEFYCINNKRAIRYIRNQDRIHCVTNVEIAKVLKRVDLYDVLVLHSLPIAFQRSRISLIANLPKKIKIAWFSWGYDLYFSTIPFYPPLVKVPFFLEKTQRVLARASFFSVKEFAKKLLKAPFSPQKYLLKKRLVERIDYCSTVLPYEFRLLKSSCPFFHGKQLFYRYASPQKAKLNDDVALSGNNILLGNSAASTSNHYDILERLSQMNLGQVKVYVPLSYGDRLNAKRINEAGARLLPSSFCPLRTLLPIHEYQKLVATCSNAIFANLRQQAMGNIFLSFGLGIKVYISKKAQFFEYLKELGYRFYSIEDDLTEENLSAATPPEWAQNNKQIFKMSRSFENIVENNKRLLETIINDMGNSYAE